jgi:hypothetical protein
MQRVAHIACTRCIENISTECREEMRLLLLLEFVVIIAGEGDSCVKKKERETVELNRRGSV